MSSSHRPCWVIQDTEKFPVAVAWKAKTIAATQLDSQKKNKGETLLRHFISSRQLTAEEILKATRSHWRIESVPQAHKLAA